MSHDFSYKFIRRWIVRVLLIAGAALAAGMLLGYCIRYLVGH